MRITPDKVMAYGPCSDYDTAEKLDKWYKGRKWVLPTTVAKMPKLPVQDAAWVLIRALNHDVPPRHGNLIMRLLLADCAMRLVREYYKDLPSIEVASMLSDQYYQVAYVIRRTDRDVITYFNELKGAQLYLRLDVGRNTDKPTLALAYDFLMRACYREADTLIYDVADAMATESHGKWFNLKLAEYLEKPHD